MSQLKLFSLMKKISTERLWVVLAEILLMQLVVLLNYIANIAATY